MEMCGSCSSFVPPRARACPACGMSSPAPVPDRARSARLLTGSLSLVGGSLLTMTLSACYGMAEPYPDFDAGPSGDAGSTCADPSTDTDSDGYCGALDCNEMDAAVHVGAFDTAGDMVDSDCGGTDAMD